MDNNSCFALIDANINRVTEGLRVLEDYSRFCLHLDPLSDSLRKKRHELWNNVNDIYGKVISKRNTEEDYYSDKKENMRAELSDIAKASFNRVKEGLRVLEEYGKIISADSSYKFKQMRFSVYEDEKVFYEAAFKEND